MKHLIVGCDVDGVLAHFDVGYREALKIVSGGKVLLPPSEEPPEWHWPEAVGYTKEEDHRAWDLIKGSPVFWAQLPATPEGVLAIKVLLGMYLEGHEVYFLTNRMGQHPHAQTQVWLFDRGFPGASVLLCPEIRWPDPKGEKISGKGLLAQGLQLTHFIDDKPENCWQVNETSPQTKCYLLSKRYNLTAQEEARRRGVIVVTTLKEFFLNLAVEENAEPRISLGV